MRRRELTVVVVLAALARVAGADAIKDAEGLFEQAQAKRQAGDEAEACKLFGESLKKNPNAVGTILNVALCDQKAGKLASAYRRFEDARDRAREQNLDEHRIAAEKHIDELGSRIGRLTIAFVDPPTATTQLTLDGVDADSAHDIVVDPGSHVVRVTEVKRAPYSTTVSVAAGERKAVAIPRLEPPKRGSKTVAKVATFGGLAMVATASVLGLVALRRYNDAFDRGDCIKASPSPCNAAGLADTKSARTMGSTATVVGGLGVVSAGLGMFLWLRF